MQNGENRIKNRNKKKGAITNQAFILTCRQLGGWSTVGDPRAARRSSTMKRFVRRNIKGKRDRAFKAPLGVA